MLKVSFVDTAENWEQTEFACSDILYHEELVEDDKIKKTFAINAEAEIDHVSFARPIGLEMTEEPTYELMLRGEFEMPWDAKDNDCVYRYEHQDMCVPTMSTSDWGSIMKELKMVYDKYANTNNNGILDLDEFVELIMDHQVEFAWWSFSWWTTVYGVPNPQIEVANLGRRYGNWTEIPCENGECLD